MLDLLKKHLRIESDTEDEYLALLLESSTLAISNRISQAVEGAVLQNQERVEGNATIPPPLRNAILIMAGTLYANREAVSYGSPACIPYAIEYLITPYIHFNAGRTP